MAQEPPAPTAGTARTDVPSTRLYRWGLRVHRHRLAVVVATILMAAVSLPLATGLGERLSPGGWLPAGAESVTVDHVLGDEFGRHSTAHYILFTDPTGTLLATDLAFRREATRTLAPLRGDPAVTNLLTWDTSVNPALASLLLADDRSAGLAIVMVSQDVREAAADVPRLRALLESDLLTIQVGGWPATTHDFQALAEADLARAEAISLPLTLLVLVFVFGGAIVAGLPLAATLLALAPTLALVTLVSHGIETSVFTVNIVVMVGLAVGVDYALVLVSRYRDERGDHAPAEALARSMATAGRTVIASGAAVAIGLLGLLALRVEAAISTGIAAAAIVFLSVAMTLTFVPAALALLGERVGPRRARGRRTWQRRLHGLGFTLRRHLDRHPLAALTAAMLILLLLAFPAFGMDPRSPTMRVLPRSEPARQMFDDVQDRFAASTLSPIVVIATPERGAMTSTANLTGLGELVEALGELDGVSGVVSVWSFVPPGIGPRWLNGALVVDRDVAIAVRPYLTANAAVIEVNVDAGAGSETARAVLATIRDDGGTLTNHQFHLFAGGETATSVDLMAHLGDRTPWAIGLVVAATALVLLVQFRSLVLPLKAIALNALSLASSFGALVWIFQDGHLAGLLGFEPLGHTIVIVPLVMFCLMFGLSMDYEVIMLSRIREEWLAGGDNRQAVALGMSRSAGIVTSAALVMLVVFGAFATSDLQVIQQIGFGLALAVAVDATLIRLVALPAAMQLLGRWNWWAPAPRWLRPPRRAERIDAHVRTP